MSSGFDGHERALQQTRQHVAPVVLVVGHARQPRVDGRRDQEELQGGPQQTRPVNLEPGLEVELWLILVQSGLHTSRKCGLRRPMEYLAMSVSDWLIAAPKRKVPTAL
ncbi:hypothetical protein CRUP_004007 [Coryphaenoides rupestris]|nr:hypothetical protein CRUP_004007 [Coryphaenoides rupestris]